MGGGSTLAHFRAICQTVTLRKHKFEARALDVTHFTFLDLLYMGVSITYVFTNIAKQQTLQHFFILS